MKVTFVILVVLLVSIRGIAVAAPAVDDATDAERYLQGLVELRTPRVLEHFIATHPASGEEVALYELARARMDLAVRDTGDGPNAAPLTDVERLALVNRVLEARRTLLAANLDNPRRPIRLADQAADILFTLLPIQGANLVTLFGVPSSDQSQRVIAALAEAVQAAGQARQSADVAIAKLESSPGYSTNAALQEQRRILAQQQRERRIPFLHSVAVILKATIAQRDAGAASANAAALQQAEAALGALLASPDALEPAVAIQSQLHRALALIDLKKFDDADALLGAAANNPDASPADVFMARLASVRLRALKYGPADGLAALTAVDASYTGKDALFFRMVLADARFLLLRDLAAAAPEDARPAQLNSALGVYTDLLNTTDATVPKQTMRAIIGARLADAAMLAERVAPLPAAQLPPLLAIARADALSRNPATVQQAIVDLEQRLEHSPATEAASTPGALGGADRAAALFVLGRALYDFHQPLLAATRFVQLAEEHPADQQAETAIELGATLATQEHNDHPGDAHATATLHHALDVLLTRYPNLGTIDRWRYVAGRLALSENRFDEAQTQFASITPTSPQWIDGHMMQAATAAARAAANTDSAKTVALNEEVLAVIDRMQPIIERGISAAPNPDPARLAAIRHYLASLRNMRAQALLNLNRAPQAIETLAHVEDTRDLAPDLLGEALTIRINAFQSLGRPDDALREVRVFLESSPGGAGVAATIAPLLDTFQRHVQALIDTSRDADASALAKKTMLPVARLLEPWLASPAGESLGIDQRAALGRRIADALRFADEPRDALAWYDRLIKTQPDAAELLLGKAECLFALGAGATTNDQFLADAMSIYKRLGAAAPTAAHDRYWLAQLRMLQIIDRANRRVEQIVPRIEQLRASDTSLGGERFRRGFDALRVKHQK